MSYNLLFEDEDDATHAPLHDRSQRPACGTTKKIRRVLPAASADPSCEDCCDLIAVAVVLLP